MAIATEELTPNPKIILPPFIIHTRYHFILIEIPYILSKLFRNQIIIRKLISHIGSNKSKFTYKRIWWL